MHQLTIPFAIAACLALLLNPAGGQTRENSDSTFIRARYTKQEVRIRMRDGVRLFTSVYAPKDTSRSHPILLNRTPYGIRPYGADSLIVNPTPMRAKYFRNGYIIVYQDVRGRSMSEGSFENVRPVSDSTGGIDETTDSYDTVDWLVRNVPHNNGRVGVSGISYGGFYSTMAAIHAHPAVKAVSPQAPVSRWMGGDDFFHHGAFLLAHAFDFFSGFGWARPVPTQAGWRPFDHGTPDGYKFFLDMSAVRNANPRYLHDSVAFWNAILAHGTWDAFWKARDVIPHMRNITPAVLFVGGWFDTENLWGTLHGYAGMERQNPGMFNRLVMGPWYHHQWGADSGTGLGVFAWGSPTTWDFVDSLEFPFFEHFLNDAPAPREFEAAVFCTGADRWEFLDAWPPHDTDTVSAFLTAAGGLSFLPPTGPPRTFDEYVSDPARPVPYTDEIRHWYNHAFMLGDQRFASRRPDVLVYQTEPFEAEKTVAGPIEAQLFVSTTGTDCDWVVKVIDVFPDSARDPVPNPAGTTMGGYQMLVRGDVVRGKFRNSLEDPRPFVPRDITPVTFSLEDVCHTFRRGHRMMVQIQSSWFPMIDLNPGKFCNIYEAREEDFSPTTQRVFHSASYPSRLRFLVRRAR